MQIFSGRALLMGVIEWITAAGNSMQIILQISPDCLCSCSPTNHNIGSFLTRSFKEKKSLFFFSLRATTPTLQVENNRSPSL